ncbi:alpha/beta hydrolase [Bacillus cereus group sp. BfR-BA-01355]|uniref:alpha/beta fold hydrolase n=1 Tax=Bacillus cereus group sp. BfR-BA-01355 TaxID=2920318 RepID=UPI001F5A5F66|nr:alpha/beta hydrolase [Bacillus cereus group sp. BfR-BA-01355]
MVLQYKEFGDSSSTLMVFIHGGGVSGWMWDKQIKHFTNFHCLVPDLLEQGKNRSKDPFSINFSAEKIIDLIEEKSQGKTVIVIGFSLGAQVLISMLSMKPNLIQYAMINSALVKSIPFANTFIKSIGLTYPLIKSRTFSKIQAKSMYIDKEYFDHYYHDSCQISKNTFIRILEENMSFTIPKNFENANSNILVTVGENEKRIMKDSLTEILKSNPRCTGVIISKIGHGISLANPKLFNTLIENWLGHDSLPEDVMTVN